MNDRNRIDGKKSAVGSVEQQHQQQRPKQLRTVGQDRRLEWWNDVVYTTMAPLYNSLDWVTCGAWWSLQRRALDHIGGTADSKSDNNNDDDDGNRINDDDDSDRRPKILEVGFGPGKLFCEMAKEDRRRQLDGIDQAKGMCDFTRERLVREGLQGTIVQGSVYDLPYANDTFDNVVTTFAFSGFSDGDRAMREMVRVAKGRVVIVDIGIPRDMNRVGTFWAKLWEWCGDFLYDIPRMMEESGLEVVHFEEYGPGNHIRVVVGQKKNT